MESGLVLRLCFWRMYPEIDIIDLTIEQFELRVQVCLRLMGICRSNSIPQSQG